MKIKVNYLITFLVINFIISSYSKFKFDDLELINHIKDSIEKAEQGISNLTQDILNLDGMSSSKGRHFLNNLLNIQGSKYLEIGVWKGSTFISALYENEKNIIKAVSIDNWEEFGGPKDSFLKNTNVFLSKNKFEFIDHDCFSLNLKEKFNDKFNIYFYDGNHTFESQKLAFTYFDEILEDTFIAIVDDFNHEPASKGTRAAFKDLNYEIVFEKHLPARYNGDTEQWWNGLYVALIKKETKSKSENLFPFPISFSIPEVKITNKIPNKNKLLASIIPGKLDTYIYENETDYYNDYKTSLFAITKIKAGWDCLRHYEILANGCIPYFEDIDNCPENTMTHLPKDTIKEAMKLYDTLKLKKSLNESDPEIIKCYEYIKELLEYTRKNLTTKSMAKYVLEKSNKNDVKKILFLSGEISPDYLRCLTLHGFKELLGTNCHDYPCIEHLYKDFPHNNIYGKGFTYSKTLDKNLRNNILDETIINDIIYHEYDIVIYGSFHRGMPFFDLVNKYYKPNEIIILCGEDIHNCPYDEYVKKGYNFFVRELN